LRFKLAAIIGGVAGVLAGQCYQRRSEKRNEAVATMTKRACPTHCRIRVSGRGPHFFRPDLVVWPCGIPQWWLLWFASHWVV